MDDTHFFFLRVWQQQHQFRAAVQSDDDGEPRLFTAPEQVGEFRREILAAGGEPASRKEFDVGGASPTAGG